MRSGCREIRDSWAPSRTAPCPQCGRIRDLRRVLRVRGIHGRPEFCLLFWCFSKGRGMVAQADLRASSTAYGHSRLKRLPFPIPGLNARPSCRAVRVGAAPHQSTTASKALERAPAPGVRGDRGRTGRPWWAPGSPPNSGPPRPRVCRAACTRIQYRLTHLTASMLRAIFDRSARIFLQLRACQPVPLGGGGGAPLS